MKNITELLGENTNGFEFMWGEPQAMLVVFKGEDPVKFEALSYNTEAEAVELARKFLDKYPRL